jgi:hypothetical protein
MPASRFPATRLTAARAHLTAPPAAARASLTTSPAAARARLTMPPAAARAHRITPPAAAREPLTDALLGPTRTARVRTLRAAAAPVARPTRASLGAASRGGA